MKTTSPKAALIILGALYYRPQIISAAALRRVALLEQENRELRAQNEQQSFRLVICLTLLFVAVVVAIWEAL
jgi:hypothetical protein